MSPPTPPGLEHHAFVSGSTPVSGGDADGKWLEFDPAKSLHMINVMVHDQAEHKFLLAWTKAGFGEGHLMPFAGVVTAGQDPVQVCHESLKKESGGVEAKELISAGSIIVVVEGNLAAIDVKVYRCTSWTGEPVESVEKKPEWFASGPSTSAHSLPPIPFDKMFADDEFWIPPFAEGKTLVGRADYAAPAVEGDLVGKLERYWFGFI